MEEPRKVKNKETNDISLKTTEEIDFRKEKVMRHS